MEPGIAAPGWGAWVSDLLKDDGDCCPGNGSEDDSPGHNAESGVPEEAAGFQSSRGLTEYAEDAGGYLLI
jgi:hypothetical protein